MDARLTEAFTEYERLVERVARLRYELAGAEAQLAHERDVLIGAARAGAPPAVKVATARPVKAPARTAPKPKAAPAPAPKAAPKPAPAATPAPWTPALAKKLLREIAGGASVLATIAAAGGTVPDSQVPRADGEGVMGVASVSPFLANVRARARSASIDLPIAAQRDGRVTLDPGLCAVLREMGGAA